MKSVAKDRRKGPRADDPNLRGRRSEPRAYIVLAASTEAMSGNRRVRLMDVSQHGARIEGSDLPAPGREIILKCGNVDSFGTVIWTTAERAGIQFDEKISGRDLVALRSLAGAMENSEMTAEELEAAEDWLNGLAR